MQVVAAQDAVRDGALRSPLAGGDR
jgi:hypothetical protein